MGARCAACFMASDSILLEVRGLRKQYVQRRWFSRSKFPIAALDGVDFTVSQGSTLVIVGESGAGKSTLARSIALLEEPSSGEIRFCGHSVSPADARKMPALRRAIQLVFQDPGSSFNPRFSAIEAVAEPLTIQAEGPPGARWKRAQELMEQVGLSPGAGGRLVSEFSGGQRQRLALARALSLQPKLLILDEAFSSLDVSIQAQLLNLLIDLRRAYSLTCVYICHDLSLAASVADEVAVMERGKIVEQGRARDVFRNPRHPHTKRLIEATLALSGGGN